MNGGKVNSKTWCLCVDSGSFKSVGGILNKTGTKGGSVLVRNTGTAYMYDTFSTANSTEIRNLVNNTGKYGSLIYAYTEDNEDYIQTQKGLRSGRVTDVEFMNDNRFHVAFYNTGYSTTRLAVWTTKDGQDDLEWIETSGLNNGGFIFKIYKSKHKNESGEYRLDLYSGKTFIDTIFVNMP